MTGSALLLMAGLVRKKIPQGLLHFRNIQHTILKLLTVQVTFDTQHMIADVGAVEPFAQTGNKVRRGFLATIYADDVQAADDLIPGIMMHEVILTAFVEHEVQRGRVAAVHGDDQHGLIISDHLAVQGVNTICAVGAFAGETFVMTKAAGMRLKIAEADDWIISVCKEPGNLITVAP